MINSAIELSPKQAEYIREAHHLFNGKIGATQCGKTYIDTLYVIPHRIIERRGKPGLNFITGVSKSTLKRNIIEPLKELWGDNLVSDINSENVATLFGEKTYCIGAEKISQLSKIRGARIKYLYIDEIVDINEEVFNFLPTRLSFDYSICDFTGNPSYPTHHIKKFIERTDIDVYCQSLTLYDNLFLPPQVIKQYEAMYKGTVYFDRYVLGKWRRAEGAIYRKFADNPAPFMIPKPDPKTLDRINVGVDFGGTGSKHACVATAVTDDDKLIVLKAKSIPAKDTDTDDLITRFILPFAAGIEKEYGRLDGMYCDSAEQTIINTVRRRSDISVYNSIKNEINDRIRATVIAMGEGRFFIVENECADLVKGLTDAVWDKDEVNDVRLDDGTSDIDVLDAFEYSFEYYLYKFQR
ncbi:MAG: phage terminase large subunit [Clostridiales bacterium]|nr:phage terminase large subunit [Clostridiales bacterium]